MGKKNKAPDELPSKAWLMSFGDTMTTLLAFFIVLCSMAEDQSGMNLYRGSGSFIASLGSGGLSGALPGDKSGQAVSFEETSPLYMVDDESTERGKDGKGPDDEDNDIPVKDREQEDFARALNEIERNAELQDEATTTGETAFDFFEKLQPKPPYLPPELDELSLRILPLLRRGTHRIEIVVWAPTPSPTARKRTSLQAQAIVGEVLAGSTVGPEKRKQIMGVSRTWPYRDEKRPVLSLVVKKVRGGKSTNNPADASTSP